MGKANVKARRARKARQKQPDKNGQFLRDAADTAKSGDTSVQ